MHWRQAHLIIEALQITVALGIRARIRDGKTSGRQLHGSCSGLAGYGRLSAPILSTIQRHSQPRCRHRAPPGIVHLLEQRAADERQPLRDGSALGWLIGCDKVRSALGKSPPLPGRNRLKASTDAIVRTSRIRSLRQHSTQRHDRCHQIRDVTAGAK